MKIDSEESLSPEMRLYDAEIENRKLKELLLKWYAFAVVGQMDAKLHSELFYETKRLIKREIEKYES